MQRVAGSERRRFVGSLGALLLALSAGTALGAPTPFTDGRLTLRFGPLYGIETPASAAPGLTGVVEVGRGPGGVLTRIEVPAGLFQAPRARFTFADPAPFPPARGVELSGVSNQAGSFVRSGTGASAAFGGALPLAGIHRVCLFFACSDPNATDLEIPLDVVGAGGIASSFAVLRVAIAGAPWTTASVTVDGPSGATTMFAGAVSPTAGGATQVQLVAPLMLSTNAVAPNDEDVPPVRGLAMLRLVLAPEPAMPLGSAIAALLTIAIGLRSRRTG